MMNCKRLLLAALIALTGVVSLAQSNAIRYVRIDGTYTADGLSWTTAKSNLQDAINDLHDYMLRNGLSTGSVYVAAGTYKPTTSTETSGDGVLNTSFILYDGISLYGGFDPVNPEATPDERVMESGSLMGNASGHRWKLKNVTVLSGNHGSSTDNPLVWNSSKNKYTEAFTGNSYHVIWFAANGFDAADRAKAMGIRAAVDGFTIQNGYASTTSFTKRSHSSYGGGVYMVENSEVRNCIIMQNASALRGGGVYMDGGGLLEQCLVMQNQSAGVGVTDGYGGGVAVDGCGMVRHCVIKDNAARAGGGLALARDVSPDDADVLYAPTATGCVVNNNTSSAEAGGVLVVNGATLNHLTIVRNECTGASVTYNNRRYGQSGGLYVEGAGMVFNSVLWGNSVDANNDVQYATYRASSSIPKAVLSYVALSQYDYVDWSGTIKKSGGVYSLSKENRNSMVKAYYPQFLRETGRIGVQTSSNDCDWTPDETSQLKSHGVQLNDYPDNSEILQAHITIDYEGNTFVPRTTLGALVATHFTGTSAMLQSIEDASQQITTIFVNPMRDEGASVNLENHAVGGSWDAPFGNLNDALAYARTLSPTATSPIQIVVKEGTATTAGNSYLSHLRSSYIDMASHVRLYGGFPASLSGTNLAGRNPVKYPTRITANITNGEYKDNGCHIVTFRHGDGSNTVLDGFQLYYANAQPNEILTELALKEGGALAVINSNASKPMTGIRIRNCIIGNCTAENGSGLFVRNVVNGQNVEVEVENCIFHNNEVTLGDDASTILARGSNVVLALNHCLIRGNVGIGVRAEDGAVVKIANSAVHANIRSSYKGSKSYITDLVATESQPDAAVVAFSTSNNGSIMLADGASVSNNMMDLGVSDATSTAIATPRFSYHSSYEQTYPKFVNPTRNIGVSEAGDITTYGGDADWTPTNMNPMVNAASESSPLFGTDMAGVERSYGGASDIGPMEDTALPMNDGNTLYVRGTDGDDNNDGLSWGKAFKTVAHAIDVAKTAVSVDETKVINVLVAQGRYTNTPGEPEQANTYRTPVFSNDSEEHWYNILLRYNTSAIKDGGDNAKLSLTNPEYGNEFQWKFIGTKDDFVMLSRSGRYVTKFDPNEKSSGRFYTGVKGGSINDAMHFYLDTDGVYVEIIRKEDTDKWGMNNRSDGVGVWNNDDIGNGVTFTDPIKRINIRTQPYAYELVERVNMYGGFPDFGNPGADERNPSLYRTVLQPIDDADAIGFPESDTVNPKNLGRVIVQDGDFTVPTTCNGFVFRNGFLNSVMTQKVAGDFTGSAVNKEILANVGGAGVYLCGNGILENCIIENNKIYAYNSNTQSGDAAGNGRLNAAAGIFNYGGTVANCQIKNNEVRVYNVNNLGTFALAGGCFMMNSTATNANGSVKYEAVMYNTLIANNRLEATSWSSNNAYHSVAIGAGITLMNGNFCNNTIVDNVAYTHKASCSNVMCAGAYLYEEANVYNSIIYNNHPQGGNTNGLMSGDKRYEQVLSLVLKQSNGDNQSNEAYSVKKDNIKIYHSNVGYKKDDGSIYQCSYLSYNAGENYTYYNNGSVQTGTYNETVTYASRNNTSELPKFVSATDYHLTGESPAINAGTEYVFGSDTYELGIPAYDAEYNDRIQDCTIDMGAYEYNGAYRITADETTEGGAVFYVNQNGAGTGSAANAANAACWTKLQKVLDAAGRYVKAGGSRRVIVKLAGDVPVETSDDGKPHLEYSGFVYRPRRSNKVTATGEEVNTRFYSFIIPHGIEVWGGYSDDFTERDILRNKTTLSGVYQTDGQNVKVYNVVTFTNDTYDESGMVQSDGTNALADIAKKAVLDGLFIEDGNADGEKSIDQNVMTTRVGGAAIVPDYAHLRNCIVQNNMAAEAGGGLYLKPGALVSGCIIQYNSVTDGHGGGVYVEEPETTDNSTYARVYTSDIIYNSASSSGGGIWFETNLRTNSSLYWRNTGSELANVAGQTNPEATSGTELTIDHYPMSFCATETIREAGINNIAVNTDIDKGVRFDKEVFSTNDGYEYYKLKSYSLLARGGMEYDMYTGLSATYDLSNSDIAAVQRTGYDNDFIDIGARAFEGHVLPQPAIGNLMTRIFVVKNDDDVALDAVEVMQNQTESSYYKQEGSSFAYPMRYLDDALEYVRDARKLKEADGSYTYKDKSFEIVLSGGTYYPMRNIKGDYVNSRGRTYLVPEGVTIIGGVAAKNVDGSFCGNVATDDDVDDESNHGFTSPSGGSVTITFPSVTEVLSSRRLNDINLNNIAEPWEMSVQTILSGQVVNSTSVDNVYHVIACIADENYVGGLPTATKSDYGDGAGQGTKPFYRGKPIVIDGVEIVDGMAADHTSAVTSLYTYYKGGGICVEGNWTTGNDFRNGSVSRPVGYRNIPLEVRNCNFRNNGGGLGGAIFTDSELKVFACNFVQNYAVVGSDIVSESERVFYAGRGGAINASYGTVVVNSLFANNEAETTPYDGTEQTGVGGAMLLGENASLHMINCDIVRNKAFGYPAVYCYRPNQGGRTDDTDLMVKNPHKIVNSILWGNEAVESGMDKVVNFAENGAETLWFCAYERGKGNDPVASQHDIDYRLQDYTGFGTYIPQLWADGYKRLSDDKTTVESVAGANPDTVDGLNPVTCNILVDSDNNAINGPNFIVPSAEAGRDGYYSSADWMIGRINNLIDNGWTYLEQDNVAFVYEADKVKGAGIYRTTAYDNINVNTGGTAVPIGNNVYMAYGDGDGSQMLRVSIDPSTTHHQAFIDLGVYEYQHVSLNYDTENGHIDVIWVTQQETTSSQISDGKTWETATSDLQRAIETLLASRNGHDKEVRLLEGVYQPVYTISGNLGFTVTTNISSGIVPPTGSEPEGVKSLTIKGGYSNTVKGQYSPADYPVWLYASERSGVEGNLLGHVLVVDDVRQRKTASDGSTETLENTVVPIVLQGLTFYNGKSQPHYDISGADCHGGAAVYYKQQTASDAPAENGNQLYKLTIRQCDFRLSGLQPNVPTVTIAGGGGKALVYNSLFRNNAGSPLVVCDTKVVNCTFACNGGSLKFTGEGSELHNSLLWNNGGDDGDVEGIAGGDSMTYNAITSLTSEDNYNNVPLSAENSDVLNGPNFIDPTKDYRINPSAKTVRKASVVPYLNLVKDLKGNFPFAAASDAERLALDRDLAGNTRYYGYGLERGAYECIATLSRVLYVNPARATGDNGFSWEKAYGHGQLQTAIDAAAVYTATATGDSEVDRRSYVFVRGMDNSVGEVISMREGVTLYGSLPSSFIGEVDGRDVDNGKVYTNQQIADFIVFAKSARDAMASVEARHTIVEGIRTDSEVAYSMFDGLMISGGSAEPAVNLSVGRGALVNCIVANNTRNVGGSLVNVDGGLLYNMLICNNMSSNPLVTLGNNGYMLNCTVVGSEGQQIVSGENILNSVAYGSDGNSPFAPYLAGKAYLGYQLLENSAHIEGGSMEAVGNLPPDLQKYVDYNSDLDLLNNPRLLNGNVDNGCFETWNVVGEQTLYANANATSYCGNHYPHTGSVAYIMDGGRLVCDRTDSDNYYFTDENPLTPGYVLVGEGGSLYGQGNSIALEYVAVERFVDGNALVSLPFRYDVEDNHVPYMFRYDSEARSNADYKFQPSDSRLWKNVDGGTQLEQNQGFLFTAPAGVYRFTAKAAPPERYVYTENEEAKKVCLTQYDDKTSTGGGADFTSRENMGWNLKGMPWLVSNYATSVMTDGKYSMHVPHTIYRLDNEGNYVKQRSWDDGVALSVGEAFFTQTAILSGEETLTFLLPKIPTGEQLVKSTGVDASDNINADDEQWKLNVSHCHVMVSNLLEDAEVGIYSLDGILRYSCMSFLGECEFDVAPGVYVVMSGRMSRKIWCSK